jgi:hypothetical protein
MRFIKGIIILPLCLIMGSCPLGPEIDIGDYESHLEKWDRQNLLDYKLSVGYGHYSDGNSKSAVIIVRNGIPKSSDPPEWLASGEMSTVPEIYFFIKEEGKRIKNANASESLTVGYNSIYHYPSSITVCLRGLGIQNTEPDPVWDWSINLMPLVENEQEAWNRQNILDYQLSLRYVELSEGTRKSEKAAVIIVENGIPVSSDPPEWLASGKMSTIPDFFSFIKEEKLDDDSINGNNVLYNLVYHFPYFMRTIDCYWYISLNGEPWG